MEDILKTTLLEFDKSTFIIDLVKYDSGRQYISIMQTIQDEETSSKRAIKINPSLLTELLKVLNSYQDLIPDNQKKQQSELTTSDNKSKKVSARILTESDKISIQNRYLKGVSIPDLTIQFDCKTELIEQVLRNNNIAIVDNNLPKSYNYNRFRRKRK